MVYTGNQYFQIYRLWFDVGIKRYTTTCAETKPAGKLWFDVGIKRYTTYLTQEQNNAQLWFDVGIKRYTTIKQFGHDV